MAAEPVLKHDKSTDAYRDEMDDLNLCHAESSLVSVHKVGTGLKAIVSYIRLSGLVDNVHPPYSIKSSKVVYTNPVRVFIENSHP